MLVGAATGLALGAALGALGGVVAPKDSVGSALSKAAQPEPSHRWDRPDAGRADRRTHRPPAPINDLGGAALKVGGGLLARIAGA